MPPLLISFFKKNWKTILITFLFIVFALLIFGAFIFYLELSCIGGLTANSMIRGFYKGAMSLTNQDTNNNTNTSTSLDEDCFVKLVRNANPNVSEETAKKYKSYVNEAASKFGINPAIIAGIIAHESVPDWNNNQCSSDHKSRGIAQITTYNSSDGCTQLEGNPRTWETTIVPGIKNEFGIELTDIMDEKQSIFASAWYLHWINKNYNLQGEDLVAAYNGGPGGYKSSDAQMYSSTVMKLVNQYAKCLNTTIDTTVDSGTVKYIVFHWTAGDYNSSHLTSSGYTYHGAVLGDGSYVKNPYKKYTDMVSHTSGFNTNSIGITISAMQIGPSGWASPECYTDIYGGNCVANYTPAPPKEVQIDTLAKVIANLSKAYNIPIDSDHVMSHGEAAMLIGDSKGKYFPERWEFIGKYIDQKQCQYTITDPSTGRMWCNYSELIRQKAKAYQ